MADITESAVWEDNIYELATTDPVKGGTPVIGVDGSVVSGHANVQAQKLANRTKYLKQRVDAWPETVDAAGTALGLVNGHDNNPDAHPGLNERTKNLEDQVASITNLFVTQFTKYADIINPQSPQFVLVNSDETNDNSRTLYFFDGELLNWVPMVEA